MRKAAQEAFALEFVKSVRVKDPGIGGMKLWYMYRQAFDGNCPVGRDRFADTGRLLTGTVRLAETALPTSSTKII